MNFIKKLFLPITATLKFIQEYFKSMLFILLLIVLFAPQEESKFIKNNLQEIKLSGTIMDSNEVVQNIEKAMKNPNIKGVLFTINSPGGAVAPSVEISYAIKRLQTVKPVVVYAQGTLASGSYYSAIWADKIVANPGSMVGSIGVIMEGGDISELMKKIGIKTQTVQAGKYKEVGTISRPWKKYELAELNKVINATYNMFTNDVAKARNLDIKQRDKWANAHIFTSAQAKEQKLIDKVGVKYDAKELLVKMSHIKNPIWNKEDKFDKLIKKLSASTSVVLYNYFAPIAMKSTL